MKNIIVLPADTYVVINKTILNDQDRKLLTMLYQPIIGSIAINLYFSLWSYLDRIEIMSSEYTHHHLMANMQLNLEDIIIAREKLEGIGLLKVYYKKGSINNYIYELYSPISAYQFFNNPILNTVFYNSVGKSEYDKTVSYFQIPKISLKDYEEITSSFHDVFASCSTTQIEFANNIKKTNTLDLSFVPQIDLSNVLESIPDEMLNKRSITKDMKDFLYKLSFVYNLNDEKISEMIRNSIGEKHTIEKEELKRNCRKYYSFEHNGKLPSLVFRNQPEYLRKPVGDNSKRAKMVYMFETTSPYDFITLKNNNVKPTKSDVAVLEMLLMDFNFHPGVVNVLIDYVLKINQNKLIKSFIETIASQWKRSKIETVEEAMNFAEKEYKNKKSYQSTKKTISKKIEKKPDWFDLNVEAKEMSLEEQKAFEERLKNIK